MGEVQLDGGDVGRVPTFQADSDLGIKKDGQGFYTSSRTAPQSALTPLAQVLKQNQSTFGYGGATTANAALIRKEARLLGVRRGSDGDYGAAYPPSTTIADPVVQRDASLAR